MTPTQLKLKTWAGFQPGKEAPASVGDIQVSIHGPTMTKEQAAALRYAQKHEVPLKDIVLDAIVAAYPTFRKWHKRPAKLSKAQLNKFVELWEVIAMKDSHEDVAYLAYTFACAWDPSGFLVLTHRDRIVATGAQEVLEYPIRDDARVAALRTGSSKTQSAKSHSAKSHSAATQRQEPKKGTKRVAKKNPPRLRLDAGGDMIVYLPVWAGFSAQQGREPSDGAVGITVGGDSGESVIGPVEEAAYRYVLDSAEATQTLMLEAIVKEFSKLRKQAAPTVQLPRKLSRASLEGLVSLQAVNIHNVSRDGVAYVGYEFSCGWDAEHGLGILLHGRRVVEVGSADTSFLTWIARQDATRASTAAPRKAVPVATAEKRSKPRPKRS